MRLAAFDPRTRTLTGLRAFDPRVRTLNGLRGGRMGWLGCNCKQPMAGLGRLARFGRMGDDSTPLENLFLDTGQQVGPVPGSVQTTMYDPGNTLISNPNTYVPTMGTNAQLQAAGFAPASPGAQLNPGTNPFPVVSAAGTQIPAQSTPSILSAAQIAALQIGAAANAAPASSIAGIPSNYLLYGGVAIVALVLLGSAKKR